jgi:hypothetical protein
MFRFATDTTELYETKGYAHLKGVVSDPIGQRMLSIVKAELLQSRIDLSGRQFPDILDRPTVDIYGPQFAPFKFLLWGLTPLMSAVSGKSLAPTYSFFRIYRNGDVLRFHTDRPACDHSMSLTLGYSDGLAWPFEVMNRGITYEEMLRSEQDVEPFSMAAGDAIIYRGVEVPHGRLAPNPNKWSAHLFLHWVDLAGPYSDHAFDSEPTVERVEFEIVEDQFS